MKGATIFTQPYLYSAVHFPITATILPRILLQKSTQLAKASFSEQEVEETAKETKKKKKNVEEIRVCTNRTCRRQGSLDTLQVLSGIAPPDVSITSCGCLGQCGSGPNAVVLPQAMFFKHCGTPTKAARLMLSALVLSGDYYHNHNNDEMIKNCLDALALRKRAEDEMDRGNYSFAEQLLSQALDLNTFGGLHIIYKDRSAARLAMGDMSEALDDSKEALALAPKYSEAYICQGDALMALDHIDGAEDSYLIALELNPSLRRSKSFKARISQLQEKSAPKNQL